MPVPMTTHRRRSGYSGGEIYAAAVPGHF
jgi:hypothetical protein